MTIRTILVYFDSAASAGRLLALAVPLAEAHGAHLLGLAVMPSYQDMPPMPDAGATVLIDEMRKAFEAEAARIKTVFDAATARQPFVAEWRLYDPGFGECVDAVARTATGADLVIASEENPSWRRGGYPDRAGLLAMQASRPLLLVPYNGDAPGSLKTIVVAWNDSRECARAVNDALPLLVKADKVIIANVSDQASAPGEAANADLAAALARHGVTCELATVPLEGRQVADTLFAFAARRGAGLVVMGAYGRSRLSEFLFGGVTRRALKGMTVPVLLAH